MKANKLKNSKANFKNSIFFNIVNFSLDIKAIRALLSIKIKKKFGINLISS